MALSPVAIDLDGALGDTRPLWDDFLVDAARRYASIAPLDPSALPGERGAAAPRVETGGSPCHCVLATGALSAVRTGRQR